MWVYSWPLHLLCLCEVGRKAYKGKQKFCMSNVVLWSTFQISLIAVIWHSFQFSVFLLISLSLRLPCWSCFRNSSWSWVKTQVLFDKLIPNVAIVLILSSFNSRSKVVTFLESSNRFDWELSSVCFLYLSNTSASQVEEPFGLGGSKRLTPFYEAFYELVVWYWGVCS